MNHAATSKPSLKFETASAKHSLPPGSALLPISSGALLVSRSHAVFCPVPENELAAVRSHIAGNAQIDTLSPALKENLEKHGFFGPPREPKAASPSVQLQITNACNLACKYCCTNSGSPRKREVTFEEMLAVVRQIPEKLGENLNVAILGGEPLLVPWALDLAEEIIALGLRLTIFTNGIPLADELLAERTAALMKRGLEVRISLAGPTPHTCDAVSEVPRFGAAITGLNNLANFGGRATLDIMLIPEHAETVAAEIPNLRKKIPPQTPLSFGVLYISGRESGAHMWKSRAALEDALDKIAFEAGETISAPKKSPLTHRREGCTCALGHHIHVRSDGALFNCFKMEEKVGELSGIGFVAAADMIRSNPHRATELPTCTACPLATICGAGCRSENLLYTGDPNTPPCGEWRVRVISELLAEDRVTALEWPVPFLLAEAKARGIDAPNLVPKTKSRHLIDV